MNDDEWERIRPLAEAEASARLAVESWGMMNTPTDPRRRIEAMVLGERLRQEWYAATRKLRDAVSSTGIMA